MKVLDLGLARVSQGQDCDLRGLGAEPDAQRGDRRVPWTTCLPNRPITSARRYPIRHLLAGLHAPDDYRETSLRRLELHGAGLVIVYGLNPCSCVTGADISPAVDAAFLLLAVEVARRTAAIDVRGDRTAQGALELPDQDQLRILRPRRVRGRIPRTILSLSMTSANRRVRMCLRGCRPEPATSVLSGVWGAVTRGSTVPCMPDSRALSLIAWDLILAAQRPPGLVRREPIAWTTTDDAGLDSDLVLTGASQPSTGSAISAASAFPSRRTRPAAWSPRRTARPPRAGPGPSRLP